jgi:hypothetical protein
MKKSFAALAALGVLFSLAMGQDAKPYSYELKNGVGTCLLKEHPLDFIWSAAIKIFMTQNTKGFTWSNEPITLNKPSGTMTGGWVMGKGVLKWDCSLNLLFEQKEEGISIFCTATRQRGGVGKKNQEKAAQKFFDELIVVLYGAPK